jgi:hypothetical protein
MLISCGQSIICSNVDCVGEIMMILVSDHLFRRMEARNCPPATHPQVACKLGTVRSRPSQRTFHLTSRRISPYRLQVSSTTTGPTRVRAFTVVSSSLLIWELPWISPLSSSGCGALCHLDSPPSITFISPPSPSLRTPGR